jgi:hypothetical protein
MNADHKFVKTTPKPNATKKSSGEDVGPVPGLFVCDDIVVGDVTEGSVDDALCAREIGVGSGREVDVWVPSSPRRTSRSTM